MDFNRIAVYGHRGWASSAIVQALIASGAPIRVLHRPGSDVSMLPSAPNVTTLAVDLENQSALVSALEGIDIAICLVGQTGVPLQHAFVKAIPQAKGVKLFVPSDLAWRHTPQGLRVRVNKVKDEVERAARDAGIPTTVVLPGGFAESFLAAGLLGVDIAGNRIVQTCDSARCQANLCAREYVAAAYASLFARTPVARLANRDIGLSEVRATGEEIRAALEKRHGGVPPQVIVNDLERVDREIGTRIAMGPPEPLALTYHCRKAWGTSQLVEGVGKDVWEVEGYQEATLEELIVQGKLGAYREIPPEKMKVIDSSFS
ncbi:NAD(P)-binding protein [Apiospora rasikravindrae]|uniref:NAD(P)-binding protein n=1 Tax=Apiospora rasikravindrae TaxID=990691 RepID=A0ABR1SYM4_9PEZI